VVGHVPQNARCLGRKRTTEGLSRAGFARACVCGHVREAIDCGAMSLH
jgi:hypothetical protein